ncbi:MAG: TonB family protein [Bacteroides sp.]|nr:TonB family protein [Bacteroides sp.]
MELKKSPKADLESQKGMFGTFGLVLALVITLVAFEWKSYDQEQIQVAARTAVDMEEDVIIQTEQNLPPPPPPPPAQISQEIEIVEDDVEIENEVEINAESNENTVVEDYVAPSVVEEDEVAEEEIFQIVEEMPGPAGGTQALYEYLSKNIRYPIAALESGIQGRVYINFVVEKDGSITDVKVMRGIGGGCDEEAVRVVKAMPKWNPGKQRGRPVRVLYSIPVIFNLN